MTQHSIAQYLQIYEDGLVRSVTHFPPSLMLATCHSARWYNSLKDRESVLNQSPALRLPGSLDNHREQTICLRLTDGKKKK